MKTLKITDKKKYPDGYWKLAVFSLGVCVLIVTIGSWLILYLVASLLVVHEKPSDPPRMNEVTSVEVIEIPNPIDNGTREFGKAKVSAEVKPADERNTKIFNYLVAYGSPIPDIATTIVEESDRHGVDPYVITAIFCQESSCGKSCSNGNCTGYGIGDVNTYGQVDFENKYHGMEVMVERFATDWSGSYKNCGSNIRCISQVGYNSNESWIGNVSWFYSEIVK